MIRTIEKYLEGDPLYCFSETDDFELLLGVCDTEAEAIEEAADYWFVGQCRKLDISKLISDFNITSILDPQFEKLDEATAGEFKYPDELFTQTMISDLISLSIGFSSVMMEWLKKHKFEKNYYIHTGGRKLVRKVANG